MSSTLQASTVPELIDQTAASFGARPFIEDDGTVITFAEFRDRAREVAAALVQRGINKGDRIAVWAPNIHEWAIAALGAQYIGAVLVTLNTRYKRAEAAYILRKSGARILFAIDNFLGVDYPAMLAGEDLPALQEIIRLRAADNAPTSWNNFVHSGAAVSAEQLDQRARAVQPDDTCDILFTSGTTGAPKGVMAGHRQNLRAFYYWSGVLGIEAGDRYLIINPFFHSFGCKAGILAAMMRGAALLPLQVFDTEVILKLISRERITVMPGPPTLFQSLLAHPDLNKYDISSLKRATTGAATIPVELIRQMRDVLKIKTVITAYGLTETCGLVTMCQEDDDAETIATTNGRAIPDVEVRCVDADGKTLPAGQAGEVVVRGYNVMQGYFENPQATAETIDADGWLHTGDVGMLDERGNLRITDRLKDMFITGGFNCYPAEIENILATHPQLAMSAVIGVPDERMGEVCMVWAVRKGGADLTEEQLIRWCREQMANYKVPRRVQFVDALPLNASGKVLKTELRARAAG